MAERGLNTLADLGDRHVIYALCNPCQRSTRLSPPRLIAVYSAQFGLQDLKRRLTCKCCGDRSQAIGIVYAVPSRSG